MKAFITINRDHPGHYMHEQFDTREEADAHVLIHGGFVFENTADLRDNTDYWIVDVEAKTVIYDQAAQDEANRQSGRMVSFDDFEERFTTQEWDDATDYSFNASVAVKRKIKQGLQRAIARNNVDLLDAKTDAFLGLLVSGGVITVQRKSEILTP